MDRTLLALTLAALAAPPAFADSEEHVIILDHRQLAASDAARENSDVWRRWADDFSREMRTSMGTLYAGRIGTGKAVKGSPYSAEVVTEANQQLADGNVITRRTSGAVYRDSEGRTRQESGGEGRERTIYITDPVESKSYVLTPGAKRAVATTYSAPRAVPLVHERELSRELSKDLAKERVKNRQVVRVNATEIRVEDGRVFVDGEEVAGGTVNLRAKSGKEVRVENGEVFIDGKEVAKIPGSGTTVSRSTRVGEDGARQEEVRVRVVRTGDDTHIPVPPIPPMPPIPPGATAALPPMPPMPGIQTMRFESTARLGKGATTNLGTKDFGGVKAEGKSTVWTIPAGEIGNRNPIQIASESWYSPELQVAVYSRHSDPRTGESIYRLASVKRGEPDANLFKVPEGYELKDRTRK